MGYTFDSISFYNAAGAIIALVVFIPFGPVSSIICLIYVIRKSGDKAFRHETGVKRLWPVLWLIISPVVLTGALSALAGLSGGI